MPKKILIVENEALIAETIKVMLEKSGYEIISIAMTGEKAVEICKKSKPDLILMDILLDGEMDGIEAYKEIKQEKNIPAVYLTAHSDDATLKTAKQTEPYGYLVKPIQKEDLVSTVEIAIYKFETETKILESEERFRAIFEQAAVGIAHVNIDGRFMKVNKKFCDISGYDQEEILNLNFKDITHPDDLDFDVKNYKKLLSGLIETYSIEKRYCKKDGSNVWVLLTVSMVKQESDGKGYIVKVIQDISHRKAVENALLDREEQLIESEERIRNIYNYSPNSIILTDLKHKIIDCNQPCLELSGVASCEDIFGKDIKDFFSAKDRKRLERNLELTISQGFVRNIEYSYTKISGDEIPVQISTSYIKDSSGAPTSFIYIISDITEHLEMERKILEIEESEREKIGRDLHDGLGQQLTGIRYMLGQVIEKLKKKIEINVSSIEDVLEQVDVAKNLTRDISHGFSSVEFKEKGFIDAVENMVGSVKKMFDVNCSFNYNKGPVDSNIAYHLYFIIKEVITNSIKHGKADTIYIDLKKSSNNINIKIRENGSIIDYPSVDNQGMGLKILKYRLSKIKCSMYFSTAQKDFNVYNFQVKDLK